MVGIKFKVANLVPFQFARKFSKINPLIINYHTISDERLKHIINLYNYRTLDAFSADLDFFAENYHLISLQDLLQSMNGKINLPPNSLFITFDDGLRECYEYVVPILLKKNIPATFFLTTEYIDNKVLGYDHKKSLLLEHIRSMGNSNVNEQIRALINLADGDINQLDDVIKNIKYNKRHLIDDIAACLKIDFDKFLNDKKPYLTTSQVREMINYGFTFGAHGTDHAMFSELTLEQQIEHAITSSNFISSAFELPYKVFAFPYTDIGVTMEFFKEIKNHIELTFGTSGLLTDPVESNFQRIGVEKFTHNALITIKFQYVRKMIYSLLRKEKIDRKL